MSPALTHIDVLNTLLLLALCGGALLTYRKAVRIHNKLFEAQRLAEERSNNLYSQLEALAALYHDLKPAASLPGTRGWAGSPDFLQHVARIATQYKPGVVVECSSGTSTVVLARCAQMNGTGHVYSLEHDTAYAIKTRSELLRQGLQEFATVLDAPLIEQRVGDTVHKWYDTSAVPKRIDLLVIDGPPWNTQSQARYPAVALLYQHLSPQARVVLDDANRPDERVAIGRWQTEFGLVIDQTLYAEKGISVLRRGDS